MAGNITRYVLQVSNIPWTVGRQQLALYFSQFGYVHNANVIFDKQTGLNQNYGFITFMKREHVNSVLKHEHTLEGKKLSLSMKYGDVDVNDDIFY